MAALPSSSTHDGRPWSESMLPPSMSATIPGHLPKSRRPIGQPLRPDPVAREGQRDPLWRRPSPAFLGGESAARSAVEVAIPTMVRSSISLRLHHAATTKHQIIHWRVHNEEYARFAEQMRRIDLLSQFPFTFLEPLALLPTGSSHVSKDIDGESRDGKEMVGYMGAKSKTVVVTCHC